jgi:agmatinase
MGMEKSQPPTFLGLEPRYTDYASARFAVLPVPYEATVSYRGGTRYAPKAILDASEQVELFDEELNGEFFRCGIATADPLASDQSGPAAMQERVYRAARRVVRGGKFLLTLGGEHGITPALVRAAAGSSRTLSVLQIDAHADLRDRYGNTPFSHASAMRRTLEYADTLVGVGIRNWSREEHRFMRQAGLQPVTARECHESDRWLDRVLDTLGDTVYVTIDIDGFDPSVAPGTGTPEPGGLDWYQVTGLLRLLAAEKTIVAADIVEVAPIPGQVVTEFLAARLAYKLIAYVQAEGRTTG